VAQPPAPKNSFGLPSGLKFYRAAPFGSVNLQASPIAVKDEQLVYNENFLRLGDSYLRTAWDIGTAIYTAPGGKTIVSFFFFTIGSTYYCAVFLSDGTAIQVNMSSFAQTTISSVANTFYNAANGQLPACVQWGTEFLLISNRNTLNDYWAWDGSLLWTAGTLAPNSLTNPTLTASGANYASTPTVTIFGGSGTGAVAVASISGGSVVLLTITNPGTGYQPGDVVQARFSGGGSDSSGQLTAVLAAGTVAAINVTNNGSGYTSAPTIAFSGGGGSSAAATAILGFPVASVSMTTTGSGYTAPVVVFTGGGGTGAAGTATVSGGSITGVSMTSNGLGYSSAPTVSFIDAAGVGATATAVLGTTGIVVGATITNAGTGYTSSPTIAFSGGGGSSAAAQALLNPEGVSSVTVTNAGSGFTEAPAITFEGGGGTGATGTVYLTGTSVARVNVTSGGSGYTSAPTVQFSATAGSGAAAVAIVASGAVVEIVLTNGGSGYNQVPLVGFSGGGGSGASASAVLIPTTMAGVWITSAGSGYTTAPAVVIGGGVNNAAYATIDVMPYGISGSCLETFQSRVWVGDPAPPLFGSLTPGGNFQFSTAGSITDFATSDGGGLFTNTDRFLLTQYVGIRQSNGYLYFFGDGSVSVLSNIQTSGVPATTTFTYQNVDPQTGLSWRDSMQDFGRSIVFGNTTGVFGLYGGNVAKISSNLDRLFVNAVFPPTNGALTPSAATATLFDVKHYLSLMTITDPDTGALRNVMITWNEKDWCLTSQSVNLIYIAGQKVSSKFTTYGTDGSKLYPLFNAPSTALVKRLDTKYYGIDSPYLIKDLWSVGLVGQDLSANNAGYSGTATFVMSGPAQQSENYPSAPSGVYADTKVLITTEVFSAPSPYWPLWTSGTNGLPFCFLGARLDITAPDFVIADILLGYVPVGFSN
jgi:hypothetical protein